jgi:hypothetical protein
MGVHTIDCLDEREALFLEQARAYFRELQLAADNAACGKVIAEAEQAAVVGGRELIREALQTVLNRAAAGAEKKTPRADAAAKPATKARRKGRS